MRPLAVAALALLSACLADRTVGPTQLAPTVVESRAEPPTKALYVVDGNVYRYPGDSIDVQPGDVETIYLIPAAVASRRYGTNNCPMIIISTKKARREHRRSAIVVRDHHPCEQPPPPPKGSILIR